MWHLSDKTPKGEIINMIFLTQVTSHNLSVEYCNLNNQLNSWTTILCLVNKYHHLNIAWGSNLTLEVVYALTQNDNPSLQI